MMLSLVPNRHVPPFGRPEVLGGKSRCDCWKKYRRALSSAGLERLPYTQEVRGSNPLAPTEVKGSPASTYRLVGFSVHW